MRSFGSRTRVEYESPDSLRKIYDKSRESSARVETFRSIQSPLSDENLGKTHLHSSEDMYELPDNSAHLMVTSPPYNVGKDYDGDVSLEE